MNNWYIITERNQKTSDLLKEAQSLFPVWAWQDFDEFDKDFPIPDVLTTREFRPNVEADENHSNKSYDDLKREGIQGITLRERIIMEIQYFKETGKHLDKLNFTLCSGSLYRDGRVPYLDWRGVELDVDRYDPDFAFPHLRTREVVSPSPSSLEPSEITVNGVRYKLTKI